MYDFLLLACMIDVYLIDNCHIICEIADGCFEREEGVVFTWEKKQYLSVVSNIVHKVK